LYNVGPLMDANCNLLGSRTHHSICYTPFFTTPLFVITISLLQRVMTLWCLVSERSLDLFSVCLSWMLTANWLADYY
jgi:hypothetical protein